MSQLTNSTRPNKKTLSSPIISTKSLPPPPSSSSLSSSSPSLIALMKLKQRNSRGSGSLPDKKSTTLSSRSSLSNPVAEQRTRAREIVSVLQQKNIKLVAIDFDNTFLSIHTSGYYQGTVESLLEHIRPTFFHLVQELLDSPAFNQTLHVCIVSFSSQEQLIRRLLQLAFKTSKTDRIVLRCNTPEFIMRMNEEFLGKENHISSVITDIATRRKKTIKPNEVLLLDDDLQNILIAEEFGHRVLEIRDEINLDILKHFACNIPSDN